MLIKKKVVEYNCLYNVTLLLLTLEDFHVPR